MLRKIFKDSGLYIFANILNKGLSLVIISFFTHYFLPFEIGVIETIFIFGSITAVLIPLGISNAIIRFLPEYNLNKEKVIAASTGWWFTFISFAITFFLFFIFSNVITQKLFSDAQYLFIFKLGLLSQAITGLQYYQQFLLRAVGNAKGFLISNLLSAIALIILTLIFLIVLDLKLAGVYYAQIIAGIIGLISAMGMNKKFLKIEIDYSILRKFLFFSIPTVPILICEFIINFIDRVIILNSLGLNKMGIYSLGVRFASVVNILMLGLSQSMTPIIYGNYQKAELPLKFARFFNLFIILAAFIIFSLILFSDLILFIFSNIHYMDAEPVISIIGCSIILFGMVNFTPGIGIVKKTLLLLKIYLIVVAISISLCYFLTPVFGMAGAAISTLISSIISFSINYYYSQKFYFIPYKIKNLYTLLIMTVILMIFKMNFNQLISFNFFPIFIRLIVLFVMMTIFIFLVIPKDEFKLVMANIKQKGNVF